MISSRAQGRISAGRRKRRAKPPSTSSSSSRRSRRPLWAPGTDARGRGARTGRCGGRRFFSRGSKIFSARCIRSRPGRRPLGSLRSIPRRGAIQRPPIPAKWRPRSAPATIAGKNIRIGSIATADGADGLPQGCGDEGHALSLRTGANQPAGAMAGPRARRAGHANVSVPGPAGVAGARTDRHPFRSEKPTTKNACARPPRCRPTAAEELQASERAVLRLRRRLAEPARFPTQWLAAVAATLVRSRPLGAMPSDQTQPTLRGRPIRDHFRLTHPNRRARHRSQGWRRSQGSGPLHQPRTPGLGGGICPDRASHAELAGQKRGTRRHADQGALTARSAAHLRGLQKNPRRQSWLKSSRGLRRSTLGATFTHRFSPHCVKKYLPDPRQEPTSAP